MKALAVGVVVMLVLPIALVLMSAAVVVSTFSGPTAWPSGFSTPSQAGVSNVQARGCILARGSDSE